MAEGWWEELESRVDVRHLMRVAYGFIISLDITPGIVHDFRARISSNKCLL